MNKKLAVLVIAAFIGGWFSSRKYHKSVAIPMSPARLEVPRGCEARFWMNGVETDCKDGATIYYVSKLPKASPR